MNAEWLYLAYWKSCSEISQPSISVKNNGVQKLRFFTTYGGPPPELNWVTFQNIPAKAKARDTFINCNIAVTYL